MQMGCGGFNVADDLTSIVFTEYKLVGDVASHAIKSISPI